MAWTAAQITLQIPNGGVCERQLSDARHGRSQSEKLRAGFAHAVLPDGADAPPSHGIAQFDHRALAWRFGDDPHDADLRQRCRPTAEPGPFLLHGE